MPSAAADISRANQNHGPKEFARVKSPFRAPGTLNLDADRAELSLDLSPE